MHPALKVPPIREAVLDLQFLAVEVDRVDAYARHIRQQFPNQTEIRSGILEMTVGNKGVALDGLPTSKVGWQCRSPSNEQIVSARVDGIAYSQAKAYAGWDNFANEGGQIWRNFVAEASPSLVTRVAARFINAIPIPPGEFDLDSWFTSVPKIPPELPQRMDGFISQLQVRIDAEYSCIISQHIERSAALEAHVVLDVDAVRQLSQPLDVFFDKSVDETLSRLHLLKNQAFFGLLTEKYIQSNSL